MHTLPTLTLVILGSKYLIYNTLFIYLLLLYVQSKNINRKIIKILKYWCFVENWSESLSVKISNQRQTKCKNWSKKLNPCTPLGGCPKQRNKMKLKVFEEVGNRENKEIEKGDGNIKLLLILYGERQRKKGTSAVWWNSWAEVTLRPKDGDGSRSHHGLTLWVEYIRPTLKILTTPSFNFVVQTHHIPNTTQGKQIKDSGDSDTWLTGHTGCPCGTLVPYLLRVNPVEHCHTSFIYTTTSSWNEGLNILKSYLILNSNLWWDDDKSNWFMWRWRWRWDTTNQPNKRIKIRDWRECNVASSLACYPLKQR